MNHRETLVSIEDALYAKLSKIATKSLRYSPSGFYKDIIVEGDLSLSNILLDGATALKTSDENKEKLSEIILEAMEYIGQKEELTWNIYYRDKRDRFDIVNRDNELLVKYITAEMGSHLALSNGQALHIYHYCATCKGSSRKSLVDRIFRSTEKILDNTSYQRAKTKIYEEYQGQIIIDSLSYLGMIKK